MTREEAMELLKSMDQKESDIFQRQAKNRNSVCICSYERKKISDMKVKGIKKKFKDKTKYELGLE